MQADDALVAPGPCAWRGSRLVLSSLIGILSHGRIRHAAPRRRPACRRARRWAGRRRGGCTPAEGGDRARVGEEELRLAAPAEDLVHVVGRRAAAAGVEALLQVGVVQEAELAVVDELVLLPLAQGLDGQAELLLELVHRIVEEVRDARVEPEDRSARRSARTRAARSRNRRTSSGSASSPLWPAVRRDGRLAVLVLRLLQPLLERLDVRAERRGSGDQLLEDALRELEHDARR